MRVPIFPGLIHLPFVENARIPDHKLRDYVLDPDHRRGGSKARWFESCLDIGQDDWEYLRDQIMEKLADAWVIGIGSKQWTENGTRYYGIEFAVRIEIVGRNGRSAEIVTGWIVVGSLAPSFTTARPS